MPSEQGVNRFIDTVTIRLEALKAKPPAGSALSRYKQIAASLRDSINDGTIPKGTKLPTHRALAERLSVTIGTVGKAYAEVERLGLVTMRVGAGTYVSDELRTFDRRQFPAVTSAHPGTIDLSLNFHLAHAEVDPLAETLRELADDRHTLESLMNYQPESGALHHRDAGSRWLAMNGVEASADNVLVTNGAQHALMSALMATARPGSVVAAEALSYPGLINAARHQGLRLRGIAIDDEGMIPDALDDACTNGGVQILFTTPTIHNPTTATMPGHRRQAIADIARRHNLIIIEDDVHGTLAIDKPPPLQRFAPERTLYISSLTKAVASGLRVGFLLTPPEIRTKTALAIRASCWMATPLSAEIATRWINNGQAEQLIKDQQREIARRKTIVDPFLEAFHPKTHPQGLHYWIQVPELWRASDTVEELRKDGVMVKAADAFSIGSGGTTQAIRVSLSGPNNDAELVDGVRRVRDLLGIGLS